MRYLTRRRMKMENKARIEALEKRVAKLKKRINYLDKANIELYARISILEEEAEKSDIVKIPFKFPSLYTYYNTDEINPNIILGYDWNCVSD